VQQRIRVAWGETQSRLSEHDEVADEEAEARAKRLGVGVNTSEALPISLNLHDKYGVRRGRQAHGTSRLHFAGAPQTSGARLAKRGGRPRPRSQSGAKSETSDESTEQSEDETDILSMSFPLVLAAVSGDTAMRQRIGTGTDAGNLTFTKNLVMAGTATGRLHERARQNTVHTIERSSSHGSVKSAEPGGSAHGAGAAMADVGSAAWTAQSAELDEGFASASSDDSDPNFRRSKRRRSKTIAAGGKTSEEVVVETGEEKPAPPDTALGRLQSISTKKISGQQMQQIICEVIAERGYRPQPFFLPESDRRRKPTAKDVNDYSLEVSRLIRDGNVDALKRLCGAGKPDDSGTRYTSINACNRFGESLLHFAARRSHRDGGLNMLRWLLRLGACPWVCDDFGRTPLHDAFWTPEPAMESVELLLRQSPDMFFTMDSRGCLPLSLSRQESLPAWKDFFCARVDELWPVQGDKPKAEPEAKPAAAKPAAAKPGAGDE